MTAATEVEAPGAGRQTAPAHPASVVRRWTHSPWGPAQTARQIIPGLGWITTSSHGGCVISQSRLDMMPAHLRVDQVFRGEGLFLEEDTDWCRAFVAFEAELLESGDEQTVRGICEGHHTDTLRDWYPEMYEAHFGVTLRPGESFVKDERSFYEQHASDFIVVSAFGSWHERVPAETVGVVARLGGRNLPGGAERYFLIPEKEYEARGRFGFVIDLTRHAETEKFC